MGASNPSGLQTTHNFLWCLWHWQEDVSILLDSAARNTYVLLLLRAPLQLSDFGCRRWCKVYRALRWAHSHTSNLAAWITCWNWIVQLQRHTVIDVHIHEQEFVTNCERHSRPPSIAYFQIIGSLGDDCAWRHSRPQRVHNRTTGVQLRQEGAVMFDTTQAFWDLLYLLKHIGPLLWHSSWPYTSILYSDQLDITTSMKP